MIKNTDNKLNKENKEEETNESEENNKLRKELEQNIEALKEIIGEKLSNSNLENVPLQKLKQILKLSDFEKQIILLCMAPEIDSSYGILYAYLQDMTVKKKPSSTLILDILCKTNEEKIKQKKFLTKSSILFKYGIIENDYADLYGHVLKINSDVLEYLLGNSERQEKHTGIELRNTRKNISVYLQDEEKIIRFTQKNQFSTTIIHGNDTDEKIIFAENIITKSKPLLLDIDLEKIFNEKEFNKNLISKTYRSIIFHNPSVFIRNISSFYSHPLKSEVFDLINNIKYQMKEISQFHNCILFLDVDEKIDSKIITIDESTLFANISTLDFGKRFHIWKNLLTEQFELKVVKDLANKYKLNSQQILSAYKYAEKRKKGTKLSEDDLFDACKRQFKDKISDLTEIINTKYEFADLILDSKKEEELRAIIDFANDNYQVFVEKNFQSITDNPEKLNILLSGPPGVGKTMMASIIAKELKLELMKIDLAKILSKFVGETEKNINRVFDDALKSNAILFFDEADSLLSKRVDTHNYMDKHSNIQLLHLTQKLERHKGIVIFATNLPKTLDQSIPRRMDKWLDIPLPGEKERCKLWGKAFPDGCGFELKEEDNLMLSKNFLLSGAHIKNIAIATAFSAIRNKEDINLKHILNAIKQEYVKMNKFPTKDEFGKYYQILEK